MDNAALNSDPMATPTVLTAAGKRRLEEELKYLRDVRVPETERLMRDAGEDGELDHPAFLDAQYQYEMLASRTERLARALANADVLEDRQRPSDGRAGLGSQVTVVDQAGAEFTYTLVSSIEAQPAAGRISAGSPVGRALFGQRAGTTITVATPASALRLSIVHVR